MLFEDKEVVEESSENTAEAGNDYKELRKECDKVAEMAALVEFFTRRKEEEVGRVDTIERGERSNLVTVG